jgi:hypothetical protein
VPTLAAVRSAPISPPRVTTARVVVVGVGAGVGAEALGVVAAAAADAGEDSVIAADVAVVAGVAAVDSVAAVDAEDLLTVAASATFRVRR